MSFPSGTNFLAAMLVPSRNVMIVWIVDGATGPSVLGAAFISRVESATRRSAVNAKSFSAVEGATRRSAASAAIRYLLASDVGTDYVVTAILCSPVKSARN
jgi:hypothetical protein